MNKIIVGSYHGLGDNVLLTPVLRKYKKLNPDSYIIFVGLKRFGDNLKELLSGLDYIDEIHSVLDDVWNDFESFEIGYKKVLEQFMEYGEKFKCDSGFFPTCKYDYPNKNNYKFHKIFRFAKEFGIKFDSIEELETDICLNMDYEQKVDDFLKGYAKPYILIHNKSGNPVKDLGSEVVEDILNKYPNASIFEFGKQSSERSVLVDEDDMEFSKMLIDKVDSVIAIDSVVMHIAGALKKDMIAIFTTTPVHQAIPILHTLHIGGIDNDTTQISKWETYKKKLIKSFNGPIIKIGEGAVKVTSNMNYQNVRLDGSEKRWKFIENKLKKLDVSDFKVLDIGCNTGFFSKKLSKICKEVVGVDIDKNCIDGLESKDNLNFYHIENLYKYLKTLETDSFDLVLYLSVHHHVYEQFDERIANNILNEISRISKYMIFETGQPDEIDNGWMPWLKMVPYFNNPKMDNIKHVIDNSKYRYNEILTSTNIHNTKRWVYWFSRDLPKPTKFVDFNGDKYEVKRYIWRTEGSNAEYRTSVEEFPIFESDIETRVRYYLVEKDDKKFLVKEKFYNCWMENKLPEDMTREEYNRGQKLLQDEEIKDYVLPAIAINDNLLLFEYVPYTNLKNYEGEAELDTNKILKVAERIRSLIGDFDFNINNILYGCGGSFKFIDFEAAECVWKDRVKIVRGFINK